ncbi:MAG: ABC transporter ATP-binding protein [Coriobacteriia bacterium]|nr:ABC transporter ATP-binding protein [Coriobacteriia bacterium]
MLQIKNIYKSYGTHRVLRDVSLSIDCGEIIGIVGPNGAGKTTLFRILARYITRYRGEVTFMETPYARVERGKIGYLAERPFQFDYFTPVEMLLFERSIKFPDLPESNLYEVLHILGLEDYLDEPIKHLSAGLKKRVAVASAFLGSPSILVLDEPLNSLDIQSTIILKQLIRDALARNAMILISSHVLDFFDGLIERTVFLKQGAIHHTCAGDARTAEEQYIDLFMPDAKEARQDIL